MENRLPLALAAVLVIGLVLLGCTQAGDFPTKPTASRGPSAYATATPYPPTSSGSMGSATPSPDPYDTSYMDQVGPDVDNLGNLTQDLSAGDVSPPPDATG